MSSCSEQRLLASGSRRFNLLRAAHHPRHLRKASHLEHGKLRPLSPGWCTQESPCSWQNFASRKWLFPTSNIFLQQSSSLGERWGKPSILEVSSLPIVLAGKLAMYAALLPAHAGTEHPTAGLCCRASSDSVGFRWHLISSVPVLASKKQQTDVRPQQFNSSLLSLSSSYFIWVWLNDISSSKDPTDGLVTSGERKSRSLQKSLEKSHQLFLFSCLLCDREGQGKQAGEEGQ